MTEYLPDGSEERIPGEWLFEKVHVAAHQTLVRDHVLRIPGHEEDRKAGPRFVDVGDEIHTRHLGHDDVGEDQVDLA
jgi:hypothetical protein